jgi:hypothetical protein
LFFVGRPAGEHALRLFPEHAGSTPEGAFPAHWLQAASELRDQAA